MKKSESRKEFFNCYVRNVIRITVLLQLRKSPAVLKLQRTSDTNKARKTDNSNNNNRPITVAEICVERNCNLMQIFKERITYVIV